MDEEEIPSDQHQMGYLNVWLTHVSSKATKAQMEEAE